MQKIIFVGSSLVPPLDISTIFALFQSSGIFPSAREHFTMSCILSANSSLHSFSIQFETLSGPCAFLISIVSIWWSVSWRDTITSHWRWFLFPFYFIFPSRPHSFPWFLLFFLVYLTLNLLSVSSRFPEFLLFSSLSIKKRTINKEINNVIFIDKWRTLNM